jgi:hypothetical protein
MTVFQVNPGDMTAASDAVTEAADGARGHGSGSGARSQRRTR